MIQNTWKRVLDGLREFGLPSSSPGRVPELIDGIADPLREFMSRAKRKANSPMKMATNVAL